MRAYGASPDQVRGIVTALAARIKVAAVPEGQRMRILLAPGPRPGDGKQIVRVVLFGERGIEGIAAANDRGLFVSVTPPNESSEPQVAAGDEDEEEDDDGTRVRLYESLYETALKNELPRQTVDDLVRIFGYDVDFQRRVAAGDSFEVFYGADDENNAAGSPVRGADGRRRDAPRLPLPGRGRTCRLFRRARPLAQEVPAPQADRRRHHALGLRLAPPPDPRLYEDAYGRRLGEPHRHADRRRPATAP